MLNFLIAASSYEARKLAADILTVIMAILSLAIIVVVMMQESETGGVSAISGGSNDSFYGKNKKRSKAQILKIVTLSIGLLMLIISVVFFCIKDM